MQNKSQSNFPILYLKAWVCLGIVLFTFCYHKGVILVPDSQSYINHYDIRMGLYPLCISLFQYCFKGYALNFLIYFQLISAFLSTYLLTHFLHKTFKLPSLLYWMCVFLFHMPIIVFQISNEILSEGLSYPLFLITSFCFLRGIWLEDIKFLYCFTFSACLLTFTRQQYIFYYIVAYSSLLYLALARPHFQKKLQYFFSITLSICAFVIAERSYHYVYHGTFSGTPFTGIEMIVRPVYISTEETSKIFKDPKEQEFIREAVKNSVAQKFMNPDLDKRELNTPTHSNLMKYQIAVPLLNQIWDKNSFDKDNGRVTSSFEYMQFIDKKALHISFNIIKNNSFSYMVSYAKEVIHGFGGYAYFGFIFLLSVVFLWNIVLKEILLPYYVLFSFASLIHLGNLMMISFFEPPIMRYTYSTAILLFSMLIVMLYPCANFHLLLKSR